MVEDIALESLGETICKQLCSANWKERLEAVEEITKVLLPSLSIKLVIYHLFLYDYCCSTKVSLAVSQLCIGNFDSLVV